MDCRETQTLLTAFHDGELPADGQGWPSAGAGRDAPGFVAPAADRERVEEHLRGCPECAAQLADLARVDQAAGVPDPGPAYWDRFNARVMDRVEREADGAKVAVLRPKGGWMRQPLRYLVPAAAAAALVVVVVRYGGMNPGAPIPTAPPAVSGPAAPASSGQRMAKAEPEPRVTEKAESTAVARLVPPPPPMTFRGAPAGAPPVPAPDGNAGGTRKRPSGIASRRTGRRPPRKWVSSSWPSCSTARRASPTPTRSSRTSTGSSRTAVRWTYTASGDRWCRSGRNSRMP